VLSLNPAVSPFASDPSNCHLLGEVLLATFLMKNRISLKVAFKILMKLTLGHDRNIFSQIYAKI